MSSDWLRKKILGKVIAIYFFTLYDNTSLQQDNAVVFAYISLLSNFYPSFQTTFLCACLLYLCWVLHSIAQFMSRSVHTASKYIIKSYIYSNMNIEFILPATKHSF